MAAARSRRSSLTKIRPVRPDRPDFPDALDGGPARPLVLVGRGCPAVCPAGGSARRLHKTPQLTGRHAESGRAYRTDLGLRCECAGSGTAGPATAGDLLATPGIGV